MDLEPQVRAGGLLAPGHPVIVLLSGGRDSTCLLDLAARIAGREATSALHVNYGLREGADGDERHCQALCEQLGIGLDIHHPVGAPEGNLQAWARDQRYGLAARLALERGGDIAAGHTASDQVETVLYRLAASPGRRALLGMRAREGRLIRPLLDFTREDTGAHCRARGLDWRDDPSNEDPAYARTRVREVLMDTLRGLHESAEANVLRTLEVLRDEAAVLDEVVEGALRDAGWAGGPAPVAVEALAALAPALRRLAVQRMADGAAGAGAPAVGWRADEVLALGAGGGTASLDLGGGLRAVVSYGELRFEPSTSLEKMPDPFAAKVPDPFARLSVPGAVEFGAGALTAEVGDFELADGTFDAQALGTELLVRAWQAGDRMRPLGLDGSKSLQDLFTDQKVPRERRHEIPVVLAGAEIAWVPGVATGEAFKVTPASVSRVRLSWQES